MKSTSKAPRVVRTKAKLPELTGQDISVKVTLKEDAVDQPDEVQEKLPIDKLVDIATTKGLLKEETAELRFDRFIKAIRLHEIVYDCMQSSFNEYCKTYNKRNPDDNIKINIILRKNKNQKTGVIFGVSCVLEIRRRDKYVTFFEKKIDFTHVKQIRDEASWKYSLYGSIYNDLIANCITYLLLQDDVNTGRIKRDVSGGNGTPDPGTKGGA